MSVNLGPRFFIGDVVSSTMPSPSPSFVARQITAMNSRDGLFFIGDLGAYRASDLRWPTPSEMDNYRKVRLEAIAAEREIAEYDRDYAECVLRDLDKEERQLKQTQKLDKQISELMAYRKQLEDGTID